ncbi:MAG TPA: sodium/calcium exchanger protein [Verrucomicrobiae bacterium]|nr:sodium/calcium exchanger protein [Verrucomicrobiae bacterium]
MNSWLHQIESTGAWAPWAFLAIFIAASFLMIWRLEAMSDGGFDGTVLGTLIMPYCSGIGNLIFAVLLAKNGGSGADVMTNALVNNVTNLTLLIGLPAIFWQATQKAKPKDAKPTKGGGPPAAELHRLSMLFTLAAVLFFTGAVWALGRDGQINFNEGLVLVGLFLFWQCFHVFEVLKTRPRGNKTRGLRLVMNLALLAVGAYASYVSIDWLARWLEKADYGFINAKNLGWLSGWLMVLPNALLAFYYSWRRKPEIVYTSQVGDGHICIPLCIGLFALFHPLKLPEFFLTGVYLLCGATVVHLLCVGVFGKLPRLVGFILVAAYGYFLKIGILR